MPQKRHTVDQIVANVRKADVELGKGKKVSEICKLLEVTEQHYYRWRQKYGGMKPEMAKQLANDSVKIPNDLGSTLTLLTQWQHAGSGQRRQQQLELLQGRYR